MDFKCDYKRKIFSHNMFSLMKVSSIEYVLRYSRDLPWFDTSFGLGSKYPIGEENIFLTDLLKSGFKITYLPNYLCSHIDITHTGDEFSVSKSLTRLNVFQRIYGPYFGRFIFFCSLLFTRHF